MMGAIFSTTAGQGNGGNIFVQVDDFVSLDNLSLMDSSVFAGGMGSGGNIEIEGRSLFLSQGSQISAGLQAVNNDMPGGQGQGGTIQINTRDSIALSGVNREGFPSIINTSTREGAQGPGGKILLDTSLLQLLDGGAISAETFNNDRGGNITINSDRLEGFDGGQISSSTSSGGDAGTIIVNVGDRITFSEINPNFERENSGVFANTSQTSTGDGGTIQITTEDFFLSNQAQITVSSDGMGSAGNLMIAAKFLRLDDLASLRAETTAGQGNIFLNTSDLILSDRSDITTNATGEATGGNIIIDAENLAALGNSDISANAEESFGGRVTIDTAGIFGTEFRDTPTPESDITATSELGP